MYPCVRPQTIRSHSLKILLALCRGCHKFLIFRYNNYLYFIASNQSANDTFVSNIAELTKITEYYLHGASREVRKCSPTNNLKGTNIISIHISQLYRNEVYMS